MIRARRWFPSSRSSRRDWACGSAIRSRSTCSAATSRRIIANLRTLDWQSLGINFVMVFSPATFRGAPATHIATLTYPGGQHGGRRDRPAQGPGRGVPSVTTVRVREAIEAFSAIVSNLVLGIRGASALTLLIAVLVLGGALAAGHRHRVYDAVVLRDGRRHARPAHPRLWARIPADRARNRPVRGRGRLGGGGLVITQVMNLPFAWLPGPALTAAGGAVGAMVVLGLIGTFTVLGQKPAPVLRSL